jgi:hypothetical protein
VRPFWHAERYEVESTVQLNALFTRIDTGAPADPTLVTLYVSDPTGATTTYTSASGVTRTGVGAYSYLLTTSEGVWVYKWQGTGAIEVTSRDEQFVVRQTLFAPPLS